VSYDLAVWDGPLPASDANAAAQFAGFMDGTDGDTVRVSAAIQTLVSKLTERWPDESDSSPWSMRPLIGNASGSFIHIPMSFAMAAEGVIVVANEAARLGLVCFDPQDEMMLN
jgi:hypothetical protein